MSYISSTMTLMAKPTDLYYRPDNYRCHSQTGLLAQAIRESWQRTNISHLQNCYPLSAGPINLDFICSRYVYGLSEIINPRSIRARVSSANTTRAGCASLPERYLSIITGNLHSPLFQSVLRLAEQEILGWEEVMNPTKSPLVDDLTRVFMVDNNGKVKSKIAAPSRGQIFAAGLEGDNAKFI